jgi:hypothetical protein
MKLIKIIQAKEVFAPHFQEKLAPSLSYKIYKLCKFAEQEEEFYNQKRRELIEEYAQRDETGAIINNNGMIQLIPDKVTEARSAMAELESIDIETPNVKFSLDELSEIRLSVADIAALDGFIEE